MYCSRCGNPVSRNWGLKYCPTCIREQTDAKSVDDELRAQIDMEFARFNMLGNVQLIENITQLFATKLQEAYKKGYMDGGIATLTQDTKGRHR